MKHAVAVLVAGTFLLGYCAAPGGAQQQAAGGFFNAICPGCVDAAEGAASAGEESAYDAWNAAFGHESPIYEWAEHVGSNAGGSSGGAAVRRTGAVGAAHARKGGAARAAHAAHAAHAA
ncbi:uncharacterized protein LOC126412233 [Schistocerca serialis cubense]|uniref:uncharacterized protein LOC126412233 n=1 Tax=Schistocerca serialis cubense TaxID=2023355 RepID=UPI00214F22D5|nr:uncharacterized protein LOC126412233 [Schistocerca serialis cubense]